MTNHTSIVVYNSEMERQMDQFLTNSGFGMVFQTILFVIVIVIFISVLFNMFKMRNGR